MAAAGAGFDAPLRGAGSSAGMVQEISLRAALMAAFARE
jgi:hypothetical protein